MSIEGSSEPLAVLNAALRVKFDPPALIPLAQDLTVVFVKGDGSRRELLFDAIERKLSEPWVTGADLTPLDALAVYPLQIEEVPEQDSDLTRRRYRLPLSNESLEVGQHSGAITLRTREDTAKPPAVIPLRVSILDPVAIVPNPLVIKYTDSDECQSGRVHVIRRASNAQAATPVKFDQNLLRVSIVDLKGSSNQTFEVASLGRPSGGIETPVTFDIGNGETRELMVRFERSKSP